MVGMLQILTYLLAFYLVIKGVEVLQIAFASNREKRTTIIVLGVIVLAVCIIAGVLFSVMQNNQAKSLSQPMGSLSSMVIPKNTSEHDESRTLRAKQDIRAIQSALEMYKLDNSVYPTTDQGLQALITQPTTNPVPSHWQQYLNRLPYDPWGNPYQYLNPGAHGSIDIWSYGPDGPSGGINHPGVIGNWNLEGSATDTNTGNNGG